jgi:hypothetical protein
MLQALVKFKPETEEKINKYKKLTTFTIALLTTSFISLYYVTHHIFLLEILPYMIFGYLFFDSFVTSGSPMIHHICGLICTYNSIKYFSKDYEQLYFLTIFNTEISTVFLIIKEWMDEYNFKKNVTSIILYNINDLLFLCLFFKLRIYDFYNLLLNPETYKILNGYSKDNQITNITAYISLYGLYFINIYWFSIICKKLYKQLIIKFLPFINNKRVSEFILTFSFFVNFYIAYLKYFLYMNNFHFFDLFGIFLLSFASGNYHYSKYRYLKHNSVINVTSNELLEPFIYDKYAIQLRSFLALTTISLIRETSRKFIYLSVCYHAISFANFNMNIIKTLFTNKQIVYDESEDSKKIIRKLDTISTIPCLIDTLMIICYHTNKYELKAELIIISVAVGLILSVKPFYNLNHVLLHLFLILQTNCISNYALQ